jgi:hypothetical protein
MTARVASRLATAADVAAFYGRPCALTMRAIVLLLGDRPVGLVGLAREADCQKLFSDTAPELEPHLRSMTVLRAIKRVMEWVHASALPVLAMSDNDRLMRRLGFECIDENEGCYLCRGRKPSRTSSPRAVRSSGPTRKRKRRKPRRSSSSTARN